MTEKRIRAIGWSKRKSRKPSTTSSNNHPIFLSVFIFLASEQLVHRAAVQLGDGGKLIRPWKRSSRLPKSHSRTVDVQRLCNIFLKKACTSTPNYKRIIHIFVTLNIITPSQLFFIITLYSSYLLLSITFSCKSENMVIFNNSYLQVK